jgi:hypothetical protein
MMMQFTKVCDASTTHDLVTCSMKSAEHQIDVLWTNNLRAHAHIEATKGAAGKSRYSDAT